MKFEFDLNKSVSNKIKHGIDFEEAKALWLDSRRIEIEARTIGESRKLIIAVLNDEIWSAIFTLRNDAIRIISVRKSRKNEKEIYYNTGI
jgi:uncharacterized protein